MDWNRLAGGGLSPVVNLPLDEDHGPNGSQEAPPRDEGSVRLQSFSVRIRPGPGFARA